MHFFHCRDRYDFKYGFQFDSQVDWEEGDWVKVKKRDKGCIEQRYREYKSVNFEENGLFAICSALDFKIHPCSSSAFF